MTLIELLVGMITAAIIASVLAKVLLIGIKTYNYAARQTASLTRTRKALAGDGVRFGVLAAGRSAYSFSSLQTSSVSFSEPSLVVTNYYVTKGNLYRTKAGASVVQTDGINSIALNYYMSTNGIISSTTVSSSATMVTALITVATGPVTSGAYNSYSLFSGAQLRNHQ
jgi:hypothetical protein